MNENLISQLALMRILAILAGSVVISVLLFLTRPESQALIKPPVPQYIDTMQLSQMDIQTTTMLAGRLRPARQATLHFEVAGQILERLVEPGQTVVTGEPLLSVEAGDYRDALSENSALLEQENRAIERDKAMLILAQKERQIMQRELDRIAALEKQSLSSPSQYEQSQQKLLSQQEREAALLYTVETAIARRSRLQAKLNRAQRNLKRARLLAPFAGVVNSVAVQVGDYVTQGQQVLQLIQIEELDVYLEVSGDMASRLGLQQSVLIKTASHSYTGRLVAVSRAPDVATNTHAVRIRIRAEALHPGDIVKVELPGKFFAAATVIPAAALLREAGQDYIYSVVDDTLRRVPVSVLASLQEQYVIDGVAVGTTIAIRDVAAYHDGQQLSTERP